MLNRLFGNKKNRYTPHKKLCLVINPPQVDSPITNSDRHNKILADTVLIVDEIINNLGRDLDEVQSL